MTLQECYKKLNGDYDGIMKRLNNEALVSKLLIKFLNTVECGDCGKAIEEENWPLAFMAAHTLKGVSLNLAFTDLAKSSSTLTELLRPQAGIDKEQAKILYDAVVLDYGKVCTVIREFANK